MALVASSCARILRWLTISTARAASRAQKTAEALAVRARFRRTNLRTR